MKVIPATRLCIVATMACCALLAGCESGDDDDEVQVRVGNYSSGNVIVVVDGAELGSVVPRQETHHEVNEGLHTVRLLRENRGLIFEQDIDIEKGQYVRYIVRSDESVRADGGGV
jgi:hypothetical protein